jgi:hypothetical protein
MSSQASLRKTILNLGRGFPPNTNAKKGGCVKHAPAFETFAY